MDRRYRNNEWDNFLEMLQDEGLPQPRTINVVCPVCDGNGKHINPAIDDNGITASEMDEYGDDFRDDYLSGAYDVTCDYCHGNRVVSDIDPEEKEMVQRWEEWQNDAYAYEAERDAERRMGC